jgi:Protein of unknown function (DUF4038)/Putative collagen-binding domain of a collagenase
MTMPRIFYYCVFVTGWVLNSSALPAQTGPARTTADSSDVVFPVKVSSDSRYLVDQNNKPFPILGRTAWFIISQPVSGYQTFLENSLSHGYNSIEMSVIGHDSRANHPPFNGNGDMPFLKQLDGSDWKGSLVYGTINTEAPDLTSPNEKYWSFVDAFLAHCESKGILVFLFPGYVGYVGTDQGWMEELIANGPAKSEAYGAWIAKRYRNQKNIVWMLLGDMGRFTISQRNAEAALIRGLKSISGQQSIHYSAESDAGQNSVDQKDFGDQMTLNGAYTWGTIGVPVMGRLAFAHQPALPSFLLEEPYDEEGPDGNHVNPHALQPVRQHQWWGWLTTIGGYISGNGYVWPFVDPYWRDHLDTQGARDMERLNHFIGSISWWELVPSGLNGMRTLITAGGGKDSTENYISAAASPKGTILVAYVPPAHQGSFTVDMTGMGKTVEAAWFDPTKGTFTKIPGSPFKNDGRRKFTPPGKNSVGERDWVLVITPTSESGKDFKF